MILILEENDHNPEALQQLLQDHGYKVTLRRGDIAGVPAWPATLEDDLPLAFLEHFVDGILIMDAHTAGVKYANQAFAAMLGYSLEEIRRQKVWDWDVVWSREEIEQMYATRNWLGEHFETRLQRKDGQVLDVAISHQPVSWRGTEVIFCAVEDISERKNNERFLQHAQFTLDKAGDMAFWVDAQGCFYYVNEAATLCLGYSREELLAMSVMGIDPDCTLREYQEHWRQLQNHGSLILERRHRAKDGRIFPVEIRVNLLVFDGKEYHCAFVTEITERKRTEEALEKRLVALTRPLEDAAGVTFDELFNLADIQRLQDDFALATGVGSLITLPDGTPLTAPSNFCRLCDLIRTSEKGIANCMKSDAALGRPAVSGPTIQKCLSGALWGAGAAISFGGRHIANWLIGQVRDGSVTEEQVRTYARDIGVDAEAAVAAFRDVPVMSVEHFSQVAQALYTLARQLSGIAYQNVQQARFITDCKRAEEALSRSECKYRSIVEHAPFGITRSTREGKLLSVNPALASILKYDSVQDLMETINRSSIQDVLFPNPDERVPLVEKIFAQDSWYVFNNHLRCKDGSIVTCRVHSRRIADKAGQGEEFESYQENITEQLAAEQALRESEEKFRVLAETTPVAVCLYQGDRIVYANPAMERLFGYSAEALCRMKLWELASEDCRELLRGRGLARLAGKNVAGQFEIKYLTRTGEKGYVLISAGMMQYRGRPTGVVSLFDISERKRIEKLVRASLEEKEVLLREIHHRVKNNLQVVSSLLFLQSQKISDPELQNCFLESQNRICSMALAHEQLYQSNNLAEVSVKTYLENLVRQQQQIFPSPGQKVDCRLAVENVRLDIEKVVPCGLLVTEFLSNAYKHAFVDRRSGQVAISLRRYVGQFELTVADDGVGLPADFDYRKADTLGLQLVTALVNQLNGTLQVENDSGACFRVRFTG